MNRIPEYLIGTVVSPSKTFREINKITKIKEYFVVMFVLLVCMHILAYLVPFSQKGLSPELKNVTNLIRQLSIVLTPIWYVLATYVQHLTARLFSKTGKFIQLLELELAIGLVYLVLDSAARIVQIFVPHLEFLSLGIFIWCCYVSVIALCVVYKISWQKSLFASLLNFVWMVIFFVILILSGVLYFVLNK